MVEVQKAAAAAEKWFDVAIVNEVYLRTDRAAANAVRIRSSASTGVPVTDQYHGDCIENPAHRKGLPRVDQPFVAVLELVISRTDCARKRMAVFKRAAEPIGVLAVRSLRLLCHRRCCEAHRKNRHEDRPPGLHESPVPVSN